MHLNKWLIIGLGNPGKNYAKTRHNIGFMVADAIATRHACTWTEHSAEPSFLECAYTYAGQSVTVVKPLTYMNLSGLVARKKAQKLALMASRCVVISDEYNFPVGRVHLRKGGSDGGHNGLTSVIQELNSADFWRLRCGIGRDFGPGGLVDYVLGAFPESDQTNLESGILKAAEAVDLIAKKGAERAMQDVNRLPPSQEITPNAS